MTALVYITSCLLFCAIAAWLDLVARTRTEVRQLHAIIRSLGDPQLTDEEKERRARQGAVATLAGGGRLMLRVAAVAATTALPVWLADSTGAIAADAVWDFALRADVLGFTVLAMILALVAGNLLALRRA